jgi:hypothetical protein
MVVILKTRFLESINNEPAFTVKRTIELRADPLATQSAPSSVCGPGWTNLER